VADGVVCGLQVQAEHALAGQRADLVALVHADDTDLVAELFHLSGPRRLEHRETDLVRLLLDDHFDRHVAAELLRIGLAVDQVRQHPRAFLELDHGQHHRRLHLERLVQDLVSDLEGEELAAAAGLDPRDVAGGAERAQHAGIEEGFAAGLALGDHQLALAGAVPVGLGFGRDRSGQGTLKVHGLVLGSQRPWNFGSRFSTKARMPSRASSVSEAMFCEKVSRSSDDFRSRSALSYSERLASRMATGGPAAIRRASWFAVLSSSS